MRKMAKVLRSMHDKHVFHGDAHLDNFLYDADRKHINPIDLERVLIFKPKDKVSIQSSIKYEFVTLLDSMEKNTGMKKEEYIPLMIEFFASYYDAPRNSDGTFKFAKDQKKWWKSYTKYDQKDLALKTFGPIYIKEMKRTANVMPYKLR